MILISNDTMLDDVYPKSTQVLFTNRENQLQHLHFFKKELQDGRPKNVCIFGSRRLGKSMLMKEFIVRNKKDTSVLMPYINIEPIVTTPHDFAIKFVGTLNYQLFGKEQNYLEYLTKESLLIKDIPQPLQNHLQRIYKELEKAVSNPSYLLTLSFSYPALITKTLNVKMMLFLDEFQEILTLGKQKNVGNPLSIFREYFTADTLSYVLAGSIVSALESIFSDEHSPLFAQAEKMYLPAFTREATKELIKKILLLQDPLIINALYTYSIGHPFYIYHLTKRMNMLQNLQEQDISVDLVKQAFIIETLSVEGKIYDLCDYLYRISLSRARYYAPLKSILNILAVEEGLNQSQIARKLRLSQGATKEYLNELVKIGFLNESDNYYFYKDAVLKYWIAYVQKGIELGGLPNKKDLLSLLHDLEEKFQKTSTELGRTKEYEFKVKLEEKIGTQFNRYITADGQIEFDLFGKKKDVVYIVEVKWRNKAVTVKDINIFLDKIQRSEFSQKKKTILLLSKSGFETKALKNAKKHNIICLDKHMNEIPTE